MDFTAVKWREDSMSSAMRRSFSAQESRAGAFRISAVIVRVAGPLKTGCSFYFLSRSRAYPLTSAVETEHERECPVDIMDAQVPQNVRQDGVPAGGGSSKAAG